MIHTAIRRLLALLMLLIVGFAYADALQELTPTTVEAYTDKIVKPAMQSSGTPGVIVSVVTDKQVIFSKGYGLADLDKQVAVDAQKTLFNLASIGKTFTAILVLQLVEEGVLDLNEDINNYLAKAGVTVTGPKLTLQNLLTHQAGFDVDLTHLFVGLGEDAEMTTDEINRRLHLLHEPGVVFGYDNIGYGVLSLVVRAVSEKPFAQLVREKIFVPLGMSSAVYITPDTDSSNLARCYIPLGPNRIKPCPEYPVYRSLIRGAGGVAASADSMARYMMMLLNRGELDGVRILSEKSFADLTNFDHYRAHPKLPGFGRAFTELNNTDRPEYAHSGTVPGFKSFMKLFPTAGVGILVSVMGSDEASFDAVPSVLISGLITNRHESKTASAAQMTLFTFADKFADEFVPSNGAQEIAPAAAAIPVEPDSINTQELAGRYYNPMDSKSLLGHLHRLISALHVSAIDANSFSVSGMGLDTLGRFTRVSPLLYSSEQGFKIAFADTALGHVLVVGASPGTFVKLPWYQASPFTVPVFILSFLILLSAAIYLLPPYRDARYHVANIALSGVVLFTIGLLLEMEYGTWFRVVQGNILLPLVWNSLLHIGLVFFLVLPVYVIKTQRKSATGTKLKNTITLSYDLLLCVAALSLVVISCLWGLAGQFI